MTPTGAVRLPDGSNRPDHPNPSNQPRTALYGSLSARQCPGRADTCTGCLQHARTALSASQTAQTAQTHPTHPAGRVRASHRRSGALGSAVSGCAFRAPVHAPSWNVLTVCACGAMFVIELRTAKTSNRKHTANSRPANIHQGLPEQDRRSGNRHTNPESTGPRPL